MSLTMKRHLTRFSSLQGLDLAAMESMPSYKLGFHKIMILNCPLGANIIFQAIETYYGINNLFPVEYGLENGHFRFYINCLAVLSRFIERSFLIKIQGGLYEIEVKLFDKTCMELLGTITSKTFMVNLIEKRFKDGELNLSNICNDTELIEKQIYLPHVSKISTDYLPKYVTSLNLSHNELIHLPLNIIMFLRTKLTSLNLSNNQIPSLTKLYDIKKLQITKLWLENNPLCEEFDDEITYVKDLLNLFPDLTELDNIRVNKNGLLVPFRRNYLIYPPVKTLVEKFILLFFSHYDDNKQILRNLYHSSACLSITTNESNVTARDALSLLPYIKLSREIIGVHIANRYKNIKVGMRSIVDALCTLPPTQHDPATFTVDVVFQRDQQTVLVIEGIFRQLPSYRPDRQPPYYNFRRTFVLTQRKSSQHYITNDMLYVRCASNVDIERSFQYPIRHPGGLMLIEPSEEERSKLIAAFSSLTNLQKNVAEERLRKTSWDLKESLSTFIEDLRTNRISSMDISSTNHETSDLSSDSDV